VAPSASQHSCWVGAAHEAPPHWFWFDVQQTFGAHEAPPQTTSAPLQVGGLVTIAPQVPGPAESRLQWNPGWQVPCVSFASQQSSSLGCAHWALGEHWVVSVLQQG
jgi:hypothetical protein